MDRLRIPVLFISWFLSAWTNLSHGRFQEMEDTSVVIFDSETNGYIVDYNDKRRCPLPPPEFNRPFYNAGIMAGHYLKKGFFLCNFPQDEPMHFDLLLEYCRMFFSDTLTWGDPIFTNVTHHSTIPVINFEEEVLTDVIFCSPDDVNLHMLFVAALRESGPDTNSRAIIQFLIPAGNGAHIFPHNKGDKDLRYLSRGATYYASDAPPENTCHFTPSFDVFVTFFRIRTYSQTYDPNVQTIPVAPTVDIDRVIVTPASNFKTLKVVSVPPILGITVNTSIYAVMEGGFLVSPTSAIGCGVINMDWDFSTRRIPKIYFPPSVSPPKIYSRFNYIQMGVGFGIFVDEPDTNLTSLMQTNSDIKDCNPEIFSKGHGKNAFFPDEYEKAKVFTTIPRLFAPCSRFDPVTTTTAMATKITIHGLVFIVFVFSINLN